MNRESYSTTLLNRKIERDYECSKVINYKEIFNDFVESYFYDELDQINVKGFPFASDFVNNSGESIDYQKYSSLSEKEKEEYRLKFYYLPYVHEVYIGTTGSGKTTTCIEPQLRAISSQKNKPNIFITDPKGEIFLHNAKHLKDNGYKVQVLNFKNIDYTNTRNPLEEIYLKQIEIKSVGKDAKKIETQCIKKVLEITCDYSKLKKFCHLYKGKVFADETSLNNFLEREKFQIHCEVTSMVNQLTRQMFPDSKKTTDPAWSNGSREFITGIMLALLDDAIDPSKNFTKEKFNVKTINDVFTLVSRYAGKKGENKLTEFLKGKSKEALDKMNIVINTAPMTRRCYLSICQTMISNWMNGHIFSITSETNISLDDSKNPIALFVITRDYDKSDNIIAGLFLNWVYKSFLKKAENKKRFEGVSSSRPMHFMLDEFANIPKIPDFEIKIATSRSRNMYFHIFLQSYEQLDVIYGRDIAKIIIDNCSQQIFLGTQSFDSKEKFSSECGEKAVKSLNSQISGNIKEIVKTSVIPISKLNNMKSGWMYIKRLKMDVIHSTYIRSYECAKQNIFKDFDNSKFEDFAPLNIINPNNQKFLYSKVIPDEFLNYGLNPNNGYLTLDKEDEDEYSFNLNHEIDSNE